MKTDYTPAGYWDRRYREGRTSGAGSEGDEGEYKAKYVERFIKSNRIGSVVDWGCGDGQVLERIDLRGTYYLGVDVSETIVNRMRSKFPKLDFTLPVEDRIWRTFDLSLSMDVLFHLPNDDDYREYINRLFGSASRFVIIYSTNYDGGRTARHVYRREFTRDVAKMLGNWELRTVETPLREGLASFFVYGRTR